MTDAAASVPLRPTPVPTTTGAGKRESSQSLTRAWDRLLLDDPVRTAELARSLDERMNVYPWRHPEGPVPVRPVVLDRGTARNITRAAAEVVRLAAAECARRAASPAELCELLGMPVSPMLTDRASWNRWALDQARPDVVLTGGVPKVLECNVSGAIGGVEQTARLESAFWSWPGVRGLTHRHRMWGGHTISARRQLLVDIARSRGVDRPPQLAVAGWSEANFSDVITDAASHEAPCVFVTQEELTEDDGLRTAHGLRIDVLLQKFVTADSYAKGEPMAALEAAVARDSTFIAAPEISTLYSDKKVLAWLTQRAPDLPPAERRIIEDHVPWTAELADRKVYRHGAQHELLRLVEHRQSDFVLKPTGGHSGHGVLIGRETAKGQWLDAVQNALDGRHVVQEFCEPDRFPVAVCDLASGAVEVIDVPHLISPMLIRGVGTGFLARFLKDTTSSMITVRLGAQNTVFVHD
ncbi:hypothetical protein ACFWCB_21390 [Streptomyces sp. NPDC060048]|uniref:hypothetical protein n=1 Tax=unclassified Streptomyces TaxID=2593676 RepID=UPI0036845A2E